MLMFLDPPKVKHAQTLTDVISICRLCFGQDGLLL
jgi:hypothetical protein